MTLLSRKLVALAAIPALSLGIVQTAFAAQTDRQVTVSTTVQDVLTFTVSSSTIALGNLTPGTPVTGNVTAQVTTNAQAGFDMSVRRDDADTTMDHTSDAASNITDKTVWDPTASAGAGNAAVWSGTGLGFRVNQTNTTAAGYSTAWWGTNDLTANAKFAGLPTAFAQVYDGSTYAATQQNVRMDLQLDVPSTQKSGAYDGTFTIRVATAV